MNRLHSQGTLAILLACLLYCTASLFGQASVTVVLSLAPLGAAHAQSTCENPPVDEPDDDGDECYFPPNMDKSIGGPTPDVNGSCPSCGVTSGQSDSKGQLVGQNAGDPISNTTGNEYEAATDYQGFGPFPMRLVRSYNSLSSTSTSPGPFGANWSFNYGSSLQISGTAILAVRGDQRVLTFTPLAGTYTQDVDVNSRVIALPGGSSGSWSYKAADDSVETYDANGRLLQITNRAGITQTLTYTSGGLLSYVTDPAGRQLHFSYDTSSRISVITDPAGHTYSYAYDANDNLISVTHPDGTVFKYLYENSAFPNALTGEIDELGVRILTITYNNAGIATGSQGAGGVNQVSLSYDFNNGITNVTDALGLTVSYTYFTVAGIEHTQSSYKPSINGAVVHKTRVFEPNGDISFYADSLDPKKFFIAAGTVQNSWTLDSNGNISSYTDFLGNTTTYTYDQTRNLELSRTEASGSAVQRTITTMWNPTFRLPAKIVQPDRTTTLMYDTNGNLTQRTITATDGSVRSWSFQSNAYGEVTLEDGPRTDISDITMYGYDGQGNLTSVTDALGHVTHITSYDPDGRPLSITDPNGTVTALTYNSRGWLTARKVGSELTSYSYNAAGLLTAVGLPSGASFGFSYDPAHRLYQISDQLGNRIVFTLDLMGNRTAEQIFAPGNHLEQTGTAVYNQLHQLAQAVGAQGQTTSYSYDNNGNLLSITDPLENVTAIRYDALNRSNQFIDPASSSTQLTLDGEDRLTSVTDPRSLLTTYTLDGLDNLNQLQSPDSGSTNNMYDAAGNLITRTDAKGQLTKYSYDALNRLTKVRRADGVVVTYTYDRGAHGIGHLTSMSDAAGETTWSYDANGHLLKKVVTMAGTVLATTYTYNAATGNVLTMTLPSGNVVGDTWTHGHITALTLNGAALVSSITYHPFSGPQSWTFANGETALRSYDLDGRIVADPVETITYDASSRVSSWTLGNHSVLTGTQSFGYDKLSRIDSYIGSGGPISYQYDPNGNRSAETVNGIGTSFTIDPASNRVTQSATGSLTASYEYDLNGSRTSLSLGPQTYIYDAVGRLQSAASNGASGTYVYDGLGERLKKTASNMNLFNYDFRGHLIGEYSTSGTLAEETIYLGDMPVALAEPSGTYFIHSDYRNTPRQIENASGVAVWAWDPTPFGDSVANQNPSGVGSFVYNLRVSGQYFDGETGMYYNYQRDYDPKLGRYLESDPIGLWGGTNTYAYAAGNPASLYDPLGLSCDSNQQMNLDETRLHFQELWERLGYLDSVLSLAGIETGYGAFDAWKNAIALLVAPTISNEVNFAASLVSIESPEFGFGWTVGTLIGDPLGKYITQIIAVSTNDSSLMRTVDPSFPLGARPDGKWGFYVPSTPGSNAIFN